jgi:vitamin B12 transporter
MKKTYLAIASLVLASPVHGQPAGQPASPAPTGQVLTVQVPTPQVPTIQAPAAPAPADQPPANQPTLGVSPTLMPNIVVTATGYPEKVSQIASTIQVITQDRIAHSPGKSVADLLAENAVGFMSQWTAGQTSINIRGGATEGQGRDFKSQVLILINGHRAGTANVSKLSIADIERIEIVRGPSSVVYGSQNMGGVINIIMKTGRTAPGNLVELDTGMWELINGKAQSGGVYKDFDWYLGAQAGSQNNYQVGGGQTEQNTYWQRAGVTGSFGYQFDENHRIDMTVRSDGVYNTGFRGSSANIFANDTRTNASFDFAYNGKTADNRGFLFLQAYYVQDVDDLNNPSPLSNLNAPAARTLIDHNHRQQDIEGIRFQPRYKFWSSNDLVVGLDWERSWLTSYRQRSGGSAVGNLSPQDNNEMNTVFAFYAEDAQRFWDDRIVVRGGVRQTWGTTSLLNTPFAPTLIPTSANYQATTYSVGATLQMTDWLSGRVGASSGFRAPTATELGSNFTVTPIGTTIFGNPGLSPETSQQLEVGMTGTWRGLRIDGALFQNVIGNRITAQTLSSVRGVVVQQYQNNPGNILVQGLEFQLESDVIQTFQLTAPPSWRWILFSNGYYNFNMTDYGATALGLPASVATRVNVYEVSVGTRFGQATTEIPWNFQVLGLLRGPMDYNTEESLSPLFFPGQVRTVTVYEKSAFWVWNLRGEVEPRKGVKFIGVLNNVFDVNEHPIFIALDQNPCRANIGAQNGSCGNSIPGRQFWAGIQVSF